jgi:hypothetical protein
VHNPNPLAVAMTAGIEEAGEPRLVVGVEPAHLLLHLGGKGRQVRGEHPAEAEPRALLVGRAEQLDVGGQLGGRVAIAGGDAPKRLGEPLAIACDESPTEIRLRGKMVVDARRADSDALRQVAVAERVVTASLRELLRDVEELIGGSGGLGDSRHAASLPIHR